MLPAYRAYEANFPPPFPPGNRRSTRCVPHTRSFSRILQWLPSLLLLAALNTPAQTAQLVTPSDVEGVSQPGAAPLPDSPGAVWSATQPLPFETLDFDGQNPGPFNTSKNSRAAQNAQPCTPRPRRRDYPRFTRDRCDPYRSFVDLAVPPLTSAEKGYLAFHDITDPFNLLTILGTSAITIGQNSHSAFGPGMRGFGYNVGTSLGQDVTGEVIGTYAVCSIFRQDPRYFRMPNRRWPRRLLHAVGHVVVAQGDNGKRIPNYANLITAAAGAEISNQYVPGIATDGASTAKRIFTGFITEPVGNIVAEFLPDVASRIHVRVVVVQRYLNQISAQ